MSSVFLLFKTLVKNQFAHNIKAVQSDWGGEYRKLSQFFQENGIVHRLACPRTHEQNGIVEQKIRHVVDIVLFMLAHSKVPLKYWDYSF